MPEIEDDDEVDNFLLGAEQLVGDDIAYPVNHRFNGRVE